MPQPQGAELDAVRTRRASLKEKYLRPPAERPRTPVRGVHHVALICRDVEQTIRFYQELLGFPLVELVENRDYAGSSIIGATRPEQLDDALAASGQKLAPSLLEALDKLNREILYPMG